MSKSTAIILGLPFILLVIIMQVYGLWGWLARDGWIQYFLMAEVYLLMLISFLFLRSIYILQNLYINAMTLLLIPMFYYLFRVEESGLGSMIHSLWYINILISVIASAWVVVFGSGLFFLVRELSKQELKKKTFLAFFLLVSVSVAMSFFIIKGQISEALMTHIWEADKLRTSWFVLEPILILSFSLMSIYFYFLNKTLKDLKKEYIFMGLLLTSLGFEYFINGFSLVSLRSTLYFLGLYSFINLIQNKELVNRFLISIFILFVFLHLSYYASAPNFFTIEVFIPFFHNALIESMKMFLVMYIYLVLYTNIKDNKFEFRLLMFLIPLIAYTYTTQSQGNGVHFYDIIAITAMLKATVAFIIILYSFYYFRANTKRKPIAKNKGKE